MTNSCKPFRGKLHNYHCTARDVLSDYRDRYIPDSIRVAWTCDTDMCLNPKHLVEVPPKRLNYPYGVCIYCGAPGWTKDHVLPRHWTGDAERKFIWVVPACGECNSFIGDSLADSVEDRRAIAHERMRRKYAGILRTKDFTREELDEFGPGLRSSIEQAIDNKKYLLARLEWPTDPYYDARALDRSLAEL